MKPIEFPEQTIVLAKDQPEYLPLPVKVDGDNVISCWELTAEEIDKVKETGKIWISMMNFGNPPYPIYPTVTKEEVII